MDPDADVAAPRPAGSGTSSRGKRVDANHLTILFPPQVDQAVRR